jgi:hypothetical protein
MQKAMGHESVTTTLRFYVRKTEDHDAILNVLNDPSDDDSEDSGDDSPSD